MSRKTKKTDLTEEELREMLMWRKSIGRESRIAWYRANGRVIDEENAPINRELSWYRGKKETIENHEPKKNRKIDGVLFVIEILAVIGIVVMFIMSSQILQHLNQAASDAFVLPTLTPTPIIQLVVLPGGHTPPDASGNTLFNESEIPEHLRSLIDHAVTPQPLLSESGQIVRIRIPAINVDAPIVSGDDWESLKQGVGFSPYSGQPGQRGNVILSAHNDIYGQIFRDLDQLKPGDEIFLLTEKSAYTYKVQETQIVRPDQVEVLAQTSDATVTLISCYPYLVDTHRIVISGKLRE